MLRHLVLTVAASATAALSAVPAASGAPMSGAPMSGTPMPRTPISALMPPPARDEDSGDRLTVTVRGMGNGADGTYERRCHPGGGSHPDVDGACQQLDGKTTWGKDPFGPVAPGTMCTMLYGGPATAHVTGTWAGRPVDARFDRTNGCEISRWDALVPLLPGTRA
ncbi:SSI family serine proteinase inhibitor [Streptomyces sp. NBC_00203]|uniref:SSI family serine proteinase inhibitor n=1 Tax=Streptomyces sp. NBC_00203 TaxID=2975680 RepID=UPI00324D1995